MPAGFRLDIQGLRAVSIAAVVFYHAQTPGFSGGYVGVDIFFVISGYLICNLLIREFVETGRVDLLRFWSRRARRLLPNACLTLAVILGVAAVVLPSHVQSSLSREGVAAALYVSNYVFAADAVDYFKSAHSPSPVLHFWSLSIEEQFYIVWPLLLLGLGLIFQRNLLTTATILLFTIWVASFVWSIMVVSENRSLAFFHTETRAWQLATGGLLATAQPLLKRLPSIILTAIAWAGFAVILVSIFAFNDSLTYPGVLALFPTLGCAAVIAGGFGRSTRFSVNGLLSFSPLQWIGARSYSVYLWHWPVFIFTAVFFDSLLLAVPVSVLIAAIIYSTVEDPIRKGKLWPASPAISLFGSGVVICGLIFIALVAFVRDPPTATLTDRLRAAALDHGRVFSDNCFLDYDALHAPDCVFGATNAGRTAVVFGDSHAAQWVAPLDKAAKATGWRLIPWVKLGCPPADITMWSKPHGAIYTLCDEWREATMKRLTGSERPDIVFLSGNTDYAGKIQDRDTSKILKERNERFDVIRRGLETTLERLRQANIRTVVIRDTPKANPNFMDCLANGGGSACALPRTEALHDPTPDIEAAQNIDNVEILDFTDLICTAVVCPLIKNGSIVYWNYHHLTATYAETLAPHFESILSEDGLSSRSRTSASR